MRTLGPRANADERNLLAELNAAIDDDGEDGRLDRFEAGPMTAATWGCCLTAPRAADPRRRVPRARRPRRRRTVRRATRRRAPERVRLDEVRPAVYRTWRGR